MTDGIIFDVDGTLWDSCDESAEAWNKEMERDPELDFHVTGDRLRQLFGKPIDIVMESVFPNLPKSKRDTYALRAHAAFNRAVIDNPPAPYDGIEDALKVLVEKYPLYVVSNCQAGYIEQLYTSTGLGKYFKDHLCYGDNHLYKAANIKIMAERHGLRNAVYVGDTLGDMISTKEAGLKFAYAAYGFGTVSEYDYLISSPKDLILL